MPLILLSHYKSIVQNNTVQYESQSADPGGDIITCCVDPANEVAAKETLETAAALAVVPIATNKIPCLKNYHHSLAARKWPLRTTNSYN